MFYSPIKHPAPIMGSNSPCKSPAWSFDQDGASRGNTTVEVVVSHPGRRRRGPDPDRHDCPDYLPLRRYKSVSSALP